MQFSWTIYICSFFLLLYFFHDNLLRAYFLSMIVLGSEDTLVKKTDKHPWSPGGDILVGQDNNWVNSH